jgi:hypothetical protein
MMFRNLRWVVTTVLVAVLTGLSFTLGVATPTAAATAPGYWLVGGDGGVFSFGAPYDGSAAADAAKCPPNTVDRHHATGQCFAIASTPDGGGYWILNGDKGAIYRFGDAGNYGEPSTIWDTMPRDTLPTARGLVPTPSGHGYWVYEINESGAATIAHFGDAGAFGDSQTLASQSHVGFNGTPVGMAARPDGTGYWEVHSDGGVFSFGRAKFYGSLASTHLASPIVGIASTNDGQGYWLASADGNVYPFGDAAHFTSLAGHALAGPVVGIAANRVGSGVWLVASDGGVFALGGAPFRGSMGGVRLAQPVFGMTMRGVSG